MQTEVGRNGGEGERGGTGGKYDYLFVLRGPSVRYFLCLYSPPRINRTIWLHEGRSTTLDACTCTLRVRVPHSKLNRIRSGSGG